MKKLYALAVIALLVSFVHADPTTHGQPNKECGAADATAMPHGFSSGGFAHAEEVYAGNGPSAIHAGSDHAVSQYDVACFQLTQH
jgi:hypothetical protein